MRRINFFQYLSLSHVVLVGIFLIVFFGLFSGFYRYHYVVPFGDDPVRHITNAMDFQERGYAQPKEGELDPPFVQILFATLSNISGVEVYHIVTYFMPFIVIAIIFSAYVAAKNIFNDYKSALFAVLLFAFFTPQPYSIYDEGTFMNLFAALLIFPLFIAYYIRSLSKNGSSAHLILSIIFGIGILGFHSLTTIYLILFLGLTTIVVVSMRSKRALIAHTTIVGVVGLVGGFIAYQFFVKRSLDFLLSKMGVIPPKPDEVIGGISNDPAGVLANFDAFSHSIGFFVLIFGVLGIILFLFRTSSAWQEKFLFLSWPLALIVGSQLSFLPLSQRFARDTVYACILLAALFFSVYVSSKCREYRFVFFSILIVFVVFASVHFINGRGNYNGLMRIKPIDLLAFEWIEKNIPKNATILSTSGVVNGGWGSYAHIITQNDFIDGGRCDESYLLEDNKCEFIYNPASNASLEYYRKNHIEYIYSHRNIEPEHFLYNRIDYSYRKTFEAVQFLDEVARFRDNNLGDIIIYKVNISK